MSAESVKNLSASLTPDVLVQRSIAADERYELILATAERLIHDRGYRAVSIRDLAKSVGVKMPSLYYYFGSKEQILYAISRRTMESLICLTDGALEAESQKDVIQRLRTAIRVGVTFHIEHQSAAGVVLSESRNLSGQCHADLRELLKAYERIFISLVSEGMDQGLFVRQDCVMATYIILSALTRISIWYRQEGRLPPQEIAACYSDLLVRMLTKDSD